MSLIPGHYDINNLPEIGRNLGTVGDGSAPIWTLVDPLSVAGLSRNLTVVLVRFDKTRENENNSVANATHY